MSLVSDQVRHLDAYLDRLPVLSEASFEDTASQSGSGDDIGLHHNLAVAEVFSSPRLDKLLRIVRSLSTLSTSNALLTTQRIKSLLSQSGIPDAVVSVQEDDLPGPPFRDADSFDPSLGPDDGKLRASYETEIEWLLVGKATVQLYGVILKTFLDNIIPLSEGIWYWDDVLSSYTYSSLYTVQTSPIRFFAWSREVYSTSASRMRSLSVRESPAEFVDSTTLGLSRQWSRFYGIVRDSIRERSFANVQRKILSPVAYCRTEARRKQAQLKQLREIAASGLGILVDEGLQFAYDIEHPNLEDQFDLKGIVERSIALMDMVLKEASEPDVNIHDFEDKVFNGVQEDPDLSVQLDDVAANRPILLARRLIRIINRTLPEHLNAMKYHVQENGRPSPLVRYWLPVTVGLLSSSTVLRILVKRRADIVEWLTDFGVTVRDFWFNWIVEPTHKVIRTIRHDEASEIAILSRDSLKADRESLERMVVDFALDKPHFATDGSPLTEAHVAEIRAKVAEGDVTPVLRAYEKDLRNPFVGAIRGDLVRALLIQVQKTKVDLEVAMTGIDSLLKSQELVFGFVGLTPGLFVSFAIMRYLRDVAFGRSAERQSEKASRAVRIFRNVDRVLTEARPNENNVLSYKDHGLLLCELHVLRNLASKVMPRDVEREFLEDLDDLANMRGIQVQARALERIRWAYARWLK
ncbi:ATP synthase regulation protein NCA2-domain-containing protein [Stachybotrys elegans]|uniref:ATP synthase regulation protein NCA2-domain-containing protein n=1 Tax=Stachybotrys elegans TaxID=80388 RepID=A0A8K0SXV8_9HYPO|nr:ATP synthase regulation protein NCA2-domain-containing protein [Stachybotrys elegans]